MLAALALAVTGCTTESPTSDPTIEPEPEPGPVGYQAVDDLCDHLDFTAVFELHDETRYTAPRPYSWKVETDADSNCDVRKTDDYDAVTLEWSFWVALYLGETPDAAPTSVARIDMTGTAEHIAGRNAGVVVEGDWEAAAAFQVELGEVEPPRGVGRATASPTYMFTTTLVVKDGNAVVQIVHTHTVSNAAALVMGREPSDQPRYSVEDLLPLLTAAAEEVLLAADAPQ
jgi:hypothetical protein